MGWGKCDMAALTGRIRQRVVYGALVVVSVLAVGRQGIHIQYGLEDVAGRHHG